MCPPSPALAGNREIAATLTRIARLLWLRGDSSYRILAYEKAAEALAEYPGSVAQLALQGELRTLPGVGNAIERAVTEYVQTGRVSLLDELQEDYPEGIVELLALPGLGPRKVRALWENLRVGDVPGLLEACRAGRVAAIPGMGPRTQERLLAAAEAAMTNSALHATRWLLGTADPPAERLLQALRGMPSVQVADIAGSIRRRSPTVKDINLTAASDSENEVFAAFAALPDVALVERPAAGVLVAATHTGIPVDLRISPPTSYGNLLQYRTGSTEHNAALYKHAQLHGFTVLQQATEPQLVGKTIQPFAFVREEGVYRHLGFDWIPPELRDDKGELEAAREGHLPQLVTRRDLRGDMHVHSVWSDGKATIAEMALAARERGLRYICICDHTRSLAVARGLDADRLLQQRAEIDVVNRQLGDDGPLVLAGCELDILADGTLDLPNDVLAELDFVVASIHTSLTQPRKQIMRRLTAAMRNPHVDAIGHPTGRLLLRRPAYDVDIDQLLTLAAETGTALEINSSFERLDLPGRIAREGAKLGIRFIISSDAHNPGGFDLLDYGVGEARRGWLEPRHILNTLPWRDWRKRKI